MKSKKQKVLDVVSDLVSKFVYYDRKDDEDLSREELAKLVRTGQVTKDEIIAKFTEELSNWNPEDC